MSTVSPAHATGSKRPSQPSIFVRAGSQAVEPEQVTMSGVTYTGDPSSFGATSEVDAPNAGLASWARATDAMRTRSRVDRRSRGFCIARTNLIERVIRGQRQWPFTCVNRERDA